MSEHDDPPEDHELYEEVPPRSIFSALWFRIVLLLIVVGVIGAVSMPYVLDWLNPPVTRSAKSSAPPPPVAEKAATEKKDTTLIPAPVIPPTAASAPAPTTTLPPSKAEPPKPEPKPAAPIVESPPPKSAPEPARAPAAKPEPAPKPTAVAKAPKAAAAPEDTKPATASKPAPAPKRAAAKATAATAGGSGGFWVQVGAFRDAATAKKLVAKLQEENYHVEESMTRAGGGSAPKSAPKPAPRASTPDIGSDQYDVFVTGQATDELTKKLSAKGLSAEPSGGGFVVKPSLPLRDAVALSKDLAVEGFKVQVKRTAASVAAAAAQAPSAPAASDSGGGESLHRVRVGAFPDRAAAQVAVKELAAKGYKPYIVRGDQ